MQYGRPHTGHSNLQFSVETRLTREERGKNSVFIKIYRIHMVARLWLTQRDTNLGE